MIQIHVDHCNKKKLREIDFTIFFLVVGILKFTLAKISVHKLHDNIKVEKFLKGFLWGECIKKANNLQKKCKQMSEKCKQIAGIYKQSAVYCKLATFTSKQLYAKCKQTVDKLVKN